MIRTNETPVVLSPIKVGVASGIYGFAVDVESGEAGPFIGAVRYEGGGADEHLVVYPGRWVGGSRRMERVQLASAAGASSVYLTTGDHPDDLVTVAASPSDRRSSRTDHLAQLAAGVNAVAGGPLAWTLMRPEGCSRLVVWALVNASATAWTRGMDFVVQGRLNGVLRDLAPVIAYSASWAATVRVGHVLSFNSSDAGLGPSIQAASHRFPFAPPDELRLQLVAGHPTVTVDLLASWSA